MQWPIEQNRIRSSGPEQRTFLPMFFKSHSPQIHCIGPLRGMTLIVEYLGGFELIFKTALGHESRVQVGTFGDITSDKKI
jgi:hypothetical protein